MWETGSDSFSVDRPLTMFVQEISFHHEVCVCWGGSSSWKVCGQNMRGQEKGLLSQSLSSQAIYWWPGTDWPWLTLDFRLELPTSGWKPASVMYRIDREVSSAIVFSIRSGFVTLETETGFPSKLEASTLSWGYFHPQSIHFLLWG